MKTFPLLTADDWGMSPGINAGILKIAELGGICRISMMPNERFIEHKLDALKNIPNLKFGLHFNLIHQEPYRSPSSLMKAWIVANKVRKKKISDWAQVELLKQISAMKSFGLRVDYFDSHQHTHIIPGLFEELSFILKAEGISEVRVPLDPTLFWTLKFPIPLLSSLLKKKVAALGFKTNQFCYPSKADLKSPTRLLALMKKNAHKEILVHPSTEDDIDALGINDGYKAGRVTEYQTLKTIFGS